MKKKNKYLLQRISLEALAVTVLFISSLFVFTYIADENVLENDGAFDSKIISYVAVHSSPLLIHIMEVITFLAQCNFFCQPIFY